MSDVWAHMGDARVVHMVKASASFEGDRVLVSVLAHCGLPYKGGQTLGAVTCRRCLRSTTASDLRTRRR